MISWRAKFWDVEGRKWLRYLLRQRNAVAYIILSFKTEPTNVFCVCLIVRDSAGVMYWGDAKLDKIEKANLDGTGRTVLLRETNVYYFAFVLHDNNLYFTDWYSQYVHVFSGDSLR